jgi:hypothetical protein
MDEKPEPPTAGAPERPDPGATRRARLALAMRANLRRRKEQQRGRVARPDAAVEPVEEA